MHLLYFLLPVLCVARVYYSLRLTYGNRIHMTMSCYIITYYYTISITVFSLYAYTDRHAEDKD